MEEEVMTVKVNVALYWSTRLSW